MTAVKHAGRKSAARNDHRHNIKRNAVDQHQRGKRQRQGRRNIGKIGGDDAKDDHKKIDDVEMRPFNGRPNDGARPIAPVKDKFFKGMNTVDGPSPAKSDAPSPSVAPAEHCARESLSHGSNLPQQQDGRGADAGPFQSSLPQWRARQDVLAATPRNIGAGARRTNMRAAGFV